MYIFDHWSTCYLDGLHYLVLRFPVWAFLQLLMRRLLLPYSLQPPSGAAVIYPFLYIFLQGVFQTPWPFIIDLEDSALFLRVSVLVLAVHFFLVKAPKLSANFLIILLTFSEKGIRRCRQNCWISPCDLVLFSPSNIFGGYPIISPDFLITTRSYGGILFRTFFPSALYFLGGLPKFSKGLLRDFDL